MRLRRLAAQLRELREECGMTQEDVSERTGKDRSTLYRLENAQQRPQRSTLIQLLDLYRVENSRRGELLALLREAGQRGWLETYRHDLPAMYADYIGFEEEARSISQFESLLIPGLLQTEDYVRALLRGTMPDAPSEQVENRVAVRLARQALLDREDPPRLWSIIDEAAVRRLVGGRDVMRSQLERLREAASRPNVTIQVIPFDVGAHPGIDGPFVILEFPDPADQSIVYTESASGSIMLEEEVEVRRHIQMFQHLRAAALSPNSSAALLAEIAAET